MMHRSMRHMAMLPLMASSLLHVTKLRADAMDAEATTRTSEDAPPNEAADRDRPMSRQERRQIERLRRKGRALGVQS